MEEFIKEVLHSCSVAAETLNSDKLKKFINNDIHFLNTSEKFTITMIGQPFSGLFDILYCLLQVKPLFSRQIQRANSSYCIKFIYSEEITFKVSNQSAQMLPIEKNEFEELFINDIEENSNKVINAEVGLNAEALKTLNINIVCSKENFKDINWICELTKTDYAILVLSASALLSLCEKKLIMGSLANLLEGERAAILVNNFDRVDEVGKSEIEETMNYVFSSKGKRIPIFYYSAYSILNSMVTRECEKKEYLKFFNFIMKELVSQSDKLRNISIKQTVNLCINELQMIIDETKKNLLCDKSKIEDAISMLKEKSTSFDAKKDSINRRIEMYIKGSVKIVLLEKIYEFNELVKKDIDKSIRKTDNLEKTKNYVSLYIEQVWEEFFNRQDSWLRNSIYSEVSEIYNSIQKDVIEVISDIDTELAHLVVTHMKNKYNEYSIDTISDMKINADNWVAVFSKYLSIGGVALFLVNIPLAIFTIGTSQALKFIFNNSIENNKREKLATIVLENCDLLEEKIVVSVNEQFKILIESIKTEANEIYNRLIQIFVTSLEEQKALIDNSKHVLKYINDLETMTIPYLKENIDYKFR